MSIRSKNPAKLRGRIEKVFYAGPKFSAGKLRSSEGDLVSFAGNVYAQEQQSVVLEGKWITDPKYGQQFKVDCVIHDIELDSEGLVHYLSNHPEIKGVGPIKARKIVEALGADFEKTLIDNPARIAEIGQISLDKAQAFRLEWLKSRKSNAVLTWLSSFELTHFQAKTLEEKLGSSCMDILQDNPYLIAREIRGFGFKKIDKIARKMGTAKDHPGRLEAGVEFCLSEALNNGHCWMEYEELVEQANLLLVMDSMDSKERIEAALDALIDEGRFSCNSEHGRMLIAFKYVFEQEQDLADRFNRSTSLNPHFKDEAKLTALISQCCQKLNDEQLAAVRMALSNSVSVISGGAGSGKSFTVSTINAICEAHDVEVILSAPTGKAAKRLEEISGREGTTVHRLLGYDGKSFARNAENPIEADVLVVDEFSMVDVSLCWQLFEAIDFSRTALILVGDHNQLPPVGPGNVLRDLIQSRVVPMVILNKVVRQAGVLKENCTAILNGEVRKSSEITISGRREWYLVDQFTEAESAARFLEELFINRLETLGFDIVKDVQVLTPTHNGLLGTKALNAMLQRLLQKKFWGVDVEVLPEGRKPKFYCNDKVIQTRNNYDLGIMNGAIGRVLEVRPNGALCINFDGMSVEIEKGSPNIGDIQLAYALTVHKTQGSEFPCAIVLIHKSHSFMHHRNLLYTAVTRAKTTAIVLGDRWGIKNCAGRCQVDDRHTFLSLLLSGANLSALEAK